MWSLHLYLFYGRSYKWEQGKIVFCIDKDNLKWLGNLEVVFSIFSALIKNIGVDSRPNVDTKRYICKLFSE